jgi:SAM-dependent methyltransferase
MRAVNWTDAPISRPCPLCGGHDTRTVSRIMQHGLNLTTVICQRCALVYTNPLPLEEVYNRFYIEAYADYYGNIAHAAADIGAESAYIRLLLDTIERAMLLRDKRVLEVGAGRGYFIYWARERGAEVLGIEPSSAFYEFLTASGLPAINATLETAPDIGTFDLIAMFHVLEHFYDPNTALQRCRALLNGGGHLAIIVPDIAAPYRSLDHYFLRYVHPTTFSRCTLGALLDKHGFEVVTSTTQGGDHWHEPRNLFVIARRRAEITTPFELPTQPADEILATLESYRRRWRWFNSPRWHLWMHTQKALRLARRGALAIKRRLIAIR